jgi:hypothetical protein
MTDNVKVWDADHIEQAVAWYERNGYVVAIRL